MATKDELMEVAEALGIEVSDDIAYWDLVRAVKEAEASPDRSDDADSDENVEEADEATVYELADYGGRDDETVHVKARPAKRYEGYEVPRIKGKRLRRG